MAPIQSVALDELQGELGAKRQMKTRARQPSLPSQRPSSLTRANPRLRSSCASQPALRQPQLDGLVFFFWLLTVGWKDLLAPPAYIGRDLERRYGYGFQWRCGLFVLALGRQAGRLAGGLAGDKVGVGGRRHATRENP